MKDLKSELSKNLERLIIGLMLTPAEFDAKMMRKAMEVKLRPGSGCIYGYFQHFLKEYVYVIRSILPEIHCCRNVS